MSEQMDDSKLRTIVRKALLEYKHGDCDLSDCADEILLAADLLRAQQSKPVVDGAMVTRAGLTYHEATKGGGCDMLAMEKALTAALSTGE
jgi:hypothetical protein